MVGVLTDPSGALAPEGKVVARSLDARLSRTAVADSQGRYSIQNLPAGRYQVSASLPNFASASQSEVTVRTGQSTRVDFVLAIPLQKIVMQVSGDPMVVGSQAIVSARTRTSDTASLLRDVPGVEQYNSGGLSSLPVIHGLGDDRVKVLINGLPLESACANHMNPPMSYVNPASVGRVRVMAGLTPVSDGGDSIGGSIFIESMPPAFSKPDEGMKAHGMISAFHRSNGVVNGGNASLYVAGENLHIGYTGSYVNANDYHDGAGSMVKSTFYEASNHALQLAARRGNHLFTADLGYQYIPQQGFVNARMDMTGNEAKYGSLRWDGSFKRFHVDARVFLENTRHSMNILRDKTPGMNMPMYAAGAGRGYLVKLEIPLTTRDTLRIGNEFRHFRLDDWWTPVSPTVGSMGPDTHWNLRNGRRDRVGSYVEWETQRGRGWTELLGIRSDVVRMNADTVVGYNMSPTTIGSAAYYADATGFNSMPRRRLDSNFDAIAMARYAPRSSRQYEFGYARKTRSPNLYERYLWVKRSAMSANMNGWFGDGNGYVGDLNLVPEVAHTLSASVTWRAPSNQGWEFKITPYYTRVNNYIDAVRCPAINDGSNGCTAAKLNATSGFVTLQFANQDARLFGVDGSGRLPLGRVANVGRFALTGVMGYVQGRNPANNGNLYQIMPLHASANLEHSAGKWSNTLEFQAVDAKRDVQAVRNELPTPGYALLNYRTSYRLPLVEGTEVRLDAGVDNMANRNYRLPLGGRYWIGDKTGSSAVPGMGRSMYAGLTFQF